MQSVNLALQSELDKGQTNPRILVDLFELYDHSYIPGDDGPDPADAIETFAAEEITWNGIAYLRKVKDRSDVVKSITEKTNSVTLNFSNADHGRYMATFAQTTDMEGLLLVIRCVSADVEDDSLVLFTGKCDKPSDIDKKGFTITAKQDFGNINVTVPPRKFSTEDPDGRLPGDPLNEGINLIAISGSLSFPQVVAKSGIAGLLGRRKTIQVTQQWSSTDGTPFGQVRPFVFGRCQMPAIHFAYADKGTHVGALSAFCDGPIAAIDQLRTRTPGISDPICNFANPPAPAVKHLGDPGGTGTNTGNTCQSDLGSGLLFSRLAYTEGAFTGWQNGQVVPFGVDQADEPAVLTAIIRGLKIPVPNISGVFASSAWSDNPAYIARFMLTDPKWCNIDPAFMDDDAFWETGKHCDEPILDKTNTQVIVIPTPDLVAAGTAFTRYKASGLYTPQYFLYYHLGDGSQVPDLVDGPYIGRDSDEATADPSDPTDSTFLEQSPLIARYKANFPVTEEIRVVDLLHKVLFPAAKMYMRVDKRGKYQVLCEQAADSTRLMTATSVGATSIPVLNILPWKTGPELLKGWVHLGFGLTTSENRQVSSAAYSTSGNSVTLSASGSGTVSATASGATLSGGSTSNPATGAITIGGGSNAPTAPSYQNVVGMTTGAGGAISKTASTGWGNAGAATSASIPIGEDGQFGGVLGLGTIAIGLGYSNAPTTNTNLAYGLQLNAISNIASLIISGGSPIPVTTCFPGDRFDVIKLGGEIRFTKNGSRINTGSVVIPAVSGTLYGNVAGFHNGANLTSAEVGTAGVAGGTVIVTIGGIAAAYQFGADVIEGIAGMLALRINADPRLNKFIQASWVAASPNVVTITCLHGALTVAALLKAHTIGIADPTTAPTVAAAASGALAAGVYKVAYSDVTANGSTSLTALASVTLTANQKINLSSLPALVGTSRDFYVSEKENSGNLKFIENRTNNSNFSINALPLPGASIPPSHNTTAEELIRIAMPFSTNSADVFKPWRRSQALAILGNADDDTYLPTVANGHKYTLTTAGTTGTTEPTWPTTAGTTVSSGSAVFTEAGSTVLQQSGLARANIVKDTFKWPLGSRQSSVNQIKGNFRDSKQDFALTPFTVNDKAHQTQVKKIYPLEVDLSAVDNENQMFRIGSYLLSKNREGDHFHSFKCSPAAMVLEEGDCISASDDSGGLINIVTRIEELRIHPNHEVTIAQSRRYSTQMYSDDAGAHRIPLASTLRFVGVKDSLAELVDIVAVRDSDALVPGFRAHVTQDLNDEGDWHGWSLWADFGDGYKQLIADDIPAIFGNAPSALGAVSDVSALDTINSVSFTLAYDDNSLADATEAEMLANPYRNLFKVGDELLQAGTITFLGGRSYTISNLLRGRFDTEDKTVHGTGERVVYLNGADRFVEMSVDKAGQTFNYKAVTTNQNVADATAFPFTWLGNNVRPRKCTDFVLVRDASNYWLIQFVMHPRPIELPAEGVVEVWADSSRNDPFKLKRRLPVTEGTTHACLLDSDGTTITDDSGEAVYYESTHTEKNNFLPAVSSASCQTIEALTTTFTRYDFTFRVNDDSLGAASGNLVSAGLHPDDDFETGSRTPVPAECPALVVWEAVNSGSDIRETVYTYGVAASTPREFPWDSDGLTIRYSIVLAGTEYRVYSDYAPSAGQAPLAVIASSSEGFPFPLRLKMQSADSATGPFYVDNVVSGGALRPSTVYAEREQIEDFGAVQDVLFLRIYQKARYEGIGNPTDI